jgi:hypothetical protein
MYDITKGFLVMNLFLFFELSKSIETICLNKSRVGGDPVCSRRAIGHPEGPVRD